MSSGPWWTANISEIKGFEQHYGFEQKEQAVCFAATWSTKGRASVLDPDGNIIAEFIPAPRKKIRRRS